MAARPPRILLLTLAFAVALTFVFFLRSPSIAPVSNLTESVERVRVSPEALKGDVIMGKLGNETAKAELGRAAWKLLHTTMARFPDKPTEDESEALRAYIYLSARLYPCGECATHFREIVSKFPPQVSTRSTAAAWACHVHNEVNKSLKKELFDCSKIGDFYDCGCQDEEEGKGKAVGVEKKEMDEKRKEKLAQNGRGFNVDTVRQGNVEIEKEGLSRGG